MSADDIRPCCRCGRQASHGGIFYITRISMAVVDRAAAQRQAGLEMMMDGNATLAGVLGDRNVVATTPYGKHAAMVCLDCFTECTLADLMAAAEGDT